MGKILMLYIILFLLLFFILYYLNTRSKILELHKESFLEYGMPPYRDARRDVISSPDCGPCRRCPIVEPTKPCKIPDMRDYMLKKNIKKCELINEDDWIDNDNYRELISESNELKENINDILKNSYNFNKALDIFYASELFNLLYKKELNELIYSEILTVADALKDLGERLTELSSDSEDKYMIFKEKGKTISDNSKGCFSEKLYDQNLKYLEHIIIFKNSVIEGILSTKKKIDKRGVELQEAEEAALAKAEQQKLLDIAAAKQKEEQRLADLVARAKKIEEQRLADLEAKAKKIEEQRLADLAKAKAKKIEEQRLADLEAKKIEKQRQLAAAAKAKKLADIEALKNWKLCYKFDNNNVLEDEERINSRNTAIVAVIDSNMLKAASNKEGDRTSLWKFTGEQPGLGFDSRGYFRPKCSASKTIIGVFGSGTGNGQSSSHNFRKEDRWGDNDIIYVFSSYGGISELFTADKTRKIHFKREKIKNGSCPDELKVSGKPYLSEFIKKFYIYQTNDKNKKFSFDDIPPDAKN